MKKTLYASLFLALLLPLALGAQELVEPSLGELLMQGTALLKTVVALNGGGFLVISAFLVALFRLAISVLKLASPFFRKKAIPKLVAILLGVAAGVFTGFAEGSNWMDVLVMMASGPGAIALNEIMKLVPAFRGKEEAGSPLYVTHAGLVQGINTADIPKVAEKVEEKSSHSE